MKKTLLTVISVFLILSVFSQHEKGDTLYFGSEDVDKSFALTIESMRPSGMKRFNARVGAEGSYRTSFLALSYMIPSKHYFELEIGAGVGAMGTYLFHTKEKYKETSQSLEISGNVKYMAKVPMIKQKNFGLRYGLGLYHLNFNSFFTRKTSSIVTTRIPLTIGISRFNVRHGKYNIYGESNIKKKRRGHLLTSVNLDAVFFPAYFHKTNAEIIQDEDAVLQGNQIHQSEYDNYVEYTENNKFGLHFSLQGILGSWSRGGGFGFRYHLGAIFYPNSGNPKIDPTGGIGLVWFFDGIAL